MKITDVDVTVFAWDDIPQVRYGSANPVTTPRGEIGLLRIATDEGIEGFAFLGSSFRSVHLDVTSLVRHLKPVVMGRDPLDRERLYRDLFSKSRATTLRAIGAMDIAIWDICGKIAGLPLYKMLGAYRTRVPAYASSSTLGDKSAYVDSLLAMKQAGFKAYKIHPPTGLKDCIEVCRKVRDAAGPDMVLMIDPAGIFDFPRRCAWAACSRSSISTGTRTR